MTENNGEDFTYILERDDFSIGAGSRRFYVGRTNDINRRMKEHSEDNYKNYHLVWKVYGNYEAKIKKFGASVFVECLMEGVRYV